MPSGFLARDRANVEFPAFGWALPSFGYGLRDPAARLSGLGCMGCPCLAGCSAGLSGIGTCGCVGCAGGCGQVGEAAAPAPGMSMTTKLAIAGAGLLVLGYIYRKDIKTQMQAAGF